MSRSLSLFFTTASICLALAILGGLVWANITFVRAQPIEKDFLVPWLGARTFIQYGDNPYGEAAAQRAQIVYYGRLAGEGEDLLQLWLPLPYELFYFPFSLITDYALARAIWMTCLEVALVALAILSLRLTGWKPARILSPFVLLFPVFWFYGALSITGGSASGFLALALIGFLLALQQEYDELAGLLLLLALGATRMMVVFFVFILWWTFYHRRWRVFAGFFMGLALLLALSFLFLPDWLVPFFSSLFSYLSNDPGLSSLEIFASWSPVVGLRLGWVFAGLLLLMLFIEWGNTLHKDFHQLVWAISVTLVVTPLMGIPMLASDYVYLFIPLVLFMSILAERWPGRWGVAGLVLLIVLIGSWFLALGLCKSGAYVTLHHTLILLFPILLLIGLYWMRWWYEHPRPTVEESLP